MTVLEYRPPSSGDILSVAARMRDADVLEVAAASGDTPLEALLKSCNDADAVFCIVLDGNPEGIFGVSYGGGLGATVWLLGTDALATIPRLMVTETRRITDDWRERFSVLHNFVDDSNEVSKRWLAAVGFNFSAPVPYGPAQVPFRYFYKIGNV
ncbi:hypothetical protein [Xanthomonas citri]|uniref:hypothetical protein n=1 Tax=Xanthomonas citri TaxID=346 RepID=UPI00068446E6|nr:hypothetical protein [Xanthomonas citri]QDS19391.1 hypothetical protein FPL05_06125 [Xanthomonas citri pv. glycines]QTK40165.1 hypothetical protein XcgCFBP7119R_05620 [Xanthomonas citri pv. glycines]